MDKKQNNGAGLTVLSKKNIKTIALVAIGIVVLIYAITQNNISKKFPAINPVKLPEIGQLPDDTSGLSAEDKKAYDERRTWITVSIGNQPTLEGVQQFQLPPGWIAREDFLLTVLPSTLPESITRSRAIIFQPQKKTSREDAIFTVPNTSNVYFEDRCYITKVPSGVCYGGNNPETKHVFELMFYFDK